MRSFLLFAFAFLCVCTASAQQTVPLGISPFEPAGTGGLRLVDEALVKLASHRRLLVVGAHPDDEDTTLLTLVGSGLGGEAAYLSLSRGEGGQNLIGPELGIGLGLIRTGELMAARQLEGTRQYFTRAYDFGYTRSLDETFDRWPQEALLEDAVYVVRTFKPQVIVTIFSGDNRDGHGQHQAAGVIAREVFAMAGVPDRYPDLTDNELPPWQPRVLYRRIWRSQEEADLQFDLGRIEPFSGHSVLQIAGASRSQHRSQDMGTLQPLGSRQAGLIQVAGDVDSGGTDVFGGIDTRLTAIADLLPEGSGRVELRARLENVAILALDARADLSPTQPAGAVPALVEICTILDEALRRVVDMGDQPGVFAVADLLNEKREIAWAALAAAAGVAVDAVADRETVTMGDSFQVTATVWNGGLEEVEVESVNVEARLDWPRTRLGRLDVESGVTGLEQWGFEIQVPDDSMPTVPYFLARARSGDLYDWSRADEIEEPGLPLQAPPVWATFRLSVAGAPVILGREVVRRLRDQARGEVRQPIRAVPVMEIEVQPSLLVWPHASAGTREVEILLRSHSSHPLAGEVRLAPKPGSGYSIESVPFRIDEPGAQQVLRIELSAPPETGGDRMELVVSAHLDDGRSFERAYPVLRYPHIRPMSLPVESRLDIQRLDMQLPQMRRLGYVRGASDRVPELLVEIGLPLEILGEADLRAADLNDYDAIVIGSRAYESDPVLGEVNSRLLRFVEDGGLLVVQYQQYQFVRGDFTPFPLEIERPHGRVTDETAPVEVLQPDHPAFATPNRLVASDWEGWVQERGLYFASSWDPAFTPLLALQDEGQPLEKGALLVAELGEGMYVYTGLSFFRQLPAGVPGAIRLFVNLLSLEKS